MIRNQAEFAKEHFDVIVLAGQSNAEGWGLGDCNPVYEPDERILALEDEHFVKYRQDGEGKTYLDVKEPTAFKISVAKEDLNDAGATRGCFALSFAKKYLQNDLADGRKILILKAAVGGTGFCKNEWRVGDPLHRRLKNMLQSALAMNPENRLVAFLWHQGESEAFQAQPVEKACSVLHNDLTAFLRDMRSIGGANNVPFICGGFVNDWASKNPAQIFPVMDCIKAFAEGCGKGIYVETADLPSNNQTIHNEDVIHFSRQSLHHLGERYYAAFKKIQ